MNVFIYSLQINSDFWTSIDFIFSYFLHVLTAWYSQRLEWYGEDMVLHLLQRPASDILRRGNEIKNKFVFVCLSMV